MDATGRGLAPLQEIPPLVMDAAGRGSAPLQESDLDCKTDAASTSAQDGGRRSDIVAHKKFWRVHFGIPIIAVPVHLDQPINARFVEDIGVGVEVVRDSTGQLHRERERE
ncbi:unnamed protein product [Fraxinus pennsylvanica]|uniref:Uncharacterized protein n=1 Tax=Fraxinus pennsylvanica TaxID=56036 RepID=A0AAD2DM04_9LAMI|nr:unnamed protein product [Fraxinus pennsylvanica]